ncbi:hypothetical protein AMJ39_07225 [candidate division TA06 bacterium DG_24]|uniref:UPF0182 protein AMJ71_09625 n=2 Tax=Bacteria division TA06 TaxID=1156500 RepID=A0A0S8JCX6_UNCT6|nr:MAG: hypothetical protein AMJ39_07225 [candidate division TA06 bacterium DG_24]KPL06685.1 MAG: hypothetical protein AMJ71_09625 [candidate division TA06 bacterium SM1_40]
MSRKIVPYIVAAAVIFLLVLVAGAWLGIYADWLWFGAVGYTSVFLKVIFARIGTGLAFGALALIIIGTNALVARSLAPRPERVIFRTPQGEIIEIPQLPARQINLLLIFGILLITVFVGMGATAKWDTVLRFIYRSPFGVSDPVFQSDVGYYVFSLPLVSFLRNWLMGMLVVAGLTATLIYLYGGRIRMLGRSLFVPPPVRRHLFILLALFFVLKAWGYRLGMYRLLYSPRGVAFGASYTDIHAQLVALRILLVLSFLTAAALIAALIIRNWRPALLSFGLLVIAAIVLGGIYPALLQKFVVEPNEAVKEEPYLRHNIEFTRLAYGLDSVEERALDIRDDLTLRDLEQNRQTIDNIRLWDWRPLRSTYSQIQEIRLYYDFNDVDVDRYLIDGSYRQVMLSARELSQQQLPAEAQTWVNLRLKFTHGYGLCMSPVNRFTEEGLPELFIADIPPRSFVDLTVERPEIYYGEETTDYILLRTTTEEFDYPSGDENRYATYEGEGGILIGSLPRRLLFAWHFRDLKLLLTEYIVAQSRIAYRRDIMSRVRTIAPFLTYDSDPYLVLAEGRLYWMTDAYTLTDAFPYSEPTRGGFNYIRNSVKVVIDAYHGRTTFYIADPTDPIITTYAGMFPDLFLPIDEMPAPLREHIRYPRNLFAVQAMIYNAYHMRDVRVFYNREDLWEIPREIYAGSEQRLEAYYTMMRLPGEENVEYVLMLPFTPSRKQNMIAWMCARSDGPSYGRLLAYKFPKERLIYGPMQIEARIDQDPGISQLITLWSQKGSEVIRGNLLVIPIEESILFVEPLYLQALQGRIPQLKRVIVAMGGRVAMEQSLDEALADIFARRPGEAGIAGEGGGVGIPGVGVEPEPGVPGVTRPSVEVPESELVQRAIQSLRRAETAAGRGDWEGFGRAMRDLEQNLEALERQ